MPFQIIKTLLLHQTDEDEKRILHCPFCGKNLFNDAGTIDPCEHVITYMHEVTGDNVGIDYIKPDHHMYPQLKARADLYVADDNNYREEIEGVIRVLDHDRDRLEHDFCFLTIDPSQGGANYRDLIVFENATDGCYL